MYSLGLLPEWELITRVPVQLNSMPLGQPLFSLTKTKDKELVLFAQHSGYKGEYASLWSLIELFRRLFPHLQWHGLPLSPVLLSFPFALSFFAPKQLTWLTRHLVNHIQHIPHPPSPSDGNKHHQVAGPCCCYCFQGNGLRGIVWTGTICVILGIKEYELIQSPLPWEIKEKSGIILSNPIPVGSPNSEADTWPQASLQTTIWTYMWQMAIWGHWSTHRLDFWDL